MVIWMPSPSIVIIAASYPLWEEDGLNHNYVVDEVECYCQVTGIPYLQVDIATRPDDSSNPGLPSCGDGRYQLHQQ